VSTNEAPCPQQSRLTNYRFFQHVFPALPIISRTQMKLRDGEPSLENLASIPTHLLVAIYATALPFCPYDDYLSVANGYRLPDDAELWRILQEELPMQIHTANLSTIQACLLYLQRPATKGTSAAADTPSMWALTASVVAQATSLGLHVDCRNWDIPPWEIRLRRRIWWAIFIDEKFRSLRRGVPSIIGDDDWDVSKLDDDEDFHGAGLAPATLSADTEVRSRHDFSQFRTMADLALIVADVYRSF
jgi:hypothetical protein